ARRNRAALSRPYRLRLCSSSVPITLTRTRACPRSADTSTPVTVTKPIRGSRTCSVRNAATVSRISSASRSGRWLGRRAISKKARAGVDHPCAGVARDQPVRLPQDALGVAAVGAHHADAQLGALPQVVVIGLGGGDVEPVVQPVLQALQHVSLVLASLAAREAQLPGHEPP